MSFSAEPRDAAPPPPDLEALRQEHRRLRDRLERERSIRRESEALAEHAVRELYDRQRAVTLLQKVAAVSNRAESVEHALQTTLDLICEYTGWPVGHGLMVSEGEAPEASSIFWAGDSTLSFALIGAGRRKMRIVIAILPMAVRMSAGVRSGGQ